MATEQNPMIWFQPIIDTTDSRVFAYQCFFANSAPRETQTAMRGVAALRRSGIHFVDVSLSAPPSVMELGQPGTVVCQMRLTYPSRQLSYLRRLKEIYTADHCGMALAVHNADDEGMDALDVIRPHYIKLHQSLVRNVEQPRLAGAIRKILQFAEDRGLTVIAEGVRSSECMENLWLLGVRNMQGDVFGPPNMAIISGSGSAIGPDGLAQNDQRRLVNPVCAR